MPERGCAGKRATASISIGPLGHNKRCCGRLRWQAVYRADSSPQFKATTLAGLGKEGIQKACRGGDEQQEMVCGEKGWQITVPASGMELCARVGAQLQIPGVRARLDGYSEGLSWPRTLSSGSDRLARWELRR